MKVYLPVALVLFLAASFLFLDGWPFRSGGRELAREPGGPPIAGAADGDGEVAPRRGSEPEGDQEFPEEPAGPSEASVRERLDAARKGGPEAHRRALSDAVLQRSLRPAFRESLLGELRQVNAGAVFATNGSSPRVAVRVQSGDNLTRIVRRVKKERGNNVTPALIMRMNRLASDRIRLGSTLAVTTEVLSVQVVKSEFRLFLLLDGVIASDYRVGIGKRDSTPEGAFIIQGKTVQPDWTMPDGRVVPFGHPEHIIGTRWLGFSTPAGRTGFGIHGTVDETTIGRSQSEGCIRMRRQDVEELFEIVPEGCAVAVLD